MSSTIMHFTACETTITTPKQSNGDVVPSVAFKFVMGATVYHRNPVGLNYVLKNKQGTITGFVNATKKRALIEWSTGQVTKHNVSSLTSSPTKESLAPSKKRKRPVQNQPHKKLQVDLSLVPIARQQKTVFSDDSDSDSDDESESPEWIENLLLQMNSMDSVSSVPRV